MTRPGRGIPSVFRGVLLALLLVTAVIVGLLAMHTLNLHGTAAADAPAAMSMSMSMSTSAHESGHVGTDMAALGGVAGDDGTSCAGCGGDEHAGMAMMCVLALLLVLLLVVPPSASRGWMRVALLTPLTDPLTARLPCAPSLHVLCISRT